MTVGRRGQTARAAALGASVLAAAAGLSSDALARRPHTKHHPDWAKHPSTKYAAMTATECKTELGQRGIAFTSVASAPGVLAPVRLTKDVGGVLFRTEAAPHVRAASPYDVFDCRLVLALSDFAKILKTHEVDEVLMFSAYRPPEKSWPSGKLATRHPGGLAMDAMRFGKKLTDGATEKKWLDVEKDFHGKIGDVPCGIDATPPRGATTESKELRSIVCEAVDQHVFTSVLTPDYDRPHHNHVHLEVTPDVSWYLVR